MKKEKAGVAKRGDSEAEGGLMIWDYQDFQRSRKTSRSHDQKANEMKNYSESVFWDGEVL